MKMENAKRIRILLNEIDELEAILERANELVDSDPNNEIYLDAKEDLQTKINTRKNEIENYSVEERRATMITQKTTSPISWAEIEKIVKSGQADKRLSVGDEITETLSAGEKIVIVVAGINTYAKNEVIFTLKDCLTDKYYMNETNTNSGGWAKSAMRKYLNDKVFSLLPDDLKAVIKPRVLKTNSETVEDKLWLFSEYEIFGEDWCDKDPDDLQIPYYRNPLKRVKLDKDGNTTRWWERSPDASNSTYFCRVDSGGSANINDASNTNGVCFGFCI